MTEPSNRGRIITFYSYKGGTGRSMALANVAWILASNGYRVLAIDWDLEAPGLHRYFHPFLEDKELESSRGVIDYFVDFARAARSAEGEPAADASWYQPFTDFVGYSKSLDWDFGSGFLDFVPAGRQDPGYSVRVGQFNWEEFYVKLGGGILIETLKNGLRDDYDYILIDSRTGISDTSGICSVQMPDDLVVCFTLNRQSIAGAAAVVSSSLSQRRKPEGGPGLRIWPIPMRVDLFEKERLERARELTRETFKDLMWQIKRADRAQYWGGIEVLYYPYFAYEEVLAAFADKPRQRNSLLAAFERVAACVTSDENDLQRSRVSALGRMSEQDRLRGLDLFVKRAPVAVTGRSVAGRIFVSYRRQDSSYVSRLAASLKERFGNEYVFTDDDIRLGDSWVNVIEEALDNSTIVLAVIGPESLHDFGPNVPSQLEAAKAMMKTVVPVLVGGAAMPHPASLPPQLQWLPQRQGVVIDDDDWDEGVARLITGLTSLLSQAQQVTTDPDDPQKGQWGGRSRANDRLLKGTVRELSPTWFEVVISVSGEKGKESLTSPVTFYLHPSFTPPSRTILPVQGVASLTLQCWGASTVGAVTDDGQTTLELDLATIAGAPTWFVEH